VSLAILPIPAVMQCIVLVYLLPWQSLLNRLAKYGMQFPSTSAPRNTVLYLKNIGPV